jgi:hypothetical protein
MVVARQPGIKKKERSRGWVSAKSTATSGLEITFAVLCADIEQFFSIFQTWVTPNSGLLMRMA